MTRITANWLNAPATQRVCAVLTDAGHQAWFVGGCVRNALIGAPDTDLDLATDALPERVMALAEAAGLRVVPTGIAHGTVTVLAEDEIFEVTTFRQDVETDGRHATVAFGNDLAADARRRDFTMNALYAGPDGAVHDPLGGFPDLMAGRVRFIGDPEARIREDYLRILRFFRFHAWYGDPEGGIDAEGLAACAASLDGLPQVSRERVGQEIRKLLSATDPAIAIASMEASGVLTQVLPGASAAFLSVLVHVEQTAGMPPDWLRRLAIIGGERPDIALRLSKAEAARLDLLTDGIANEQDAGTLGYRHGQEIALDILALRSVMSGNEIDTDQAEQTNLGARQVMPVRAQDLMPELQGPALGDALRRIEERWIASGFSLTRDELL